jgi:hypothetical protein
MYTCNVRNTVVFASMHFAKLVTSRVGAGGQAPTILKELTERTSRSPLQIDIDTGIDIYNNKKKLENIVNRGTRQAFHSVLGVAYHCNKSSSFALPRHFPGKLTGVKSRSIVLSIVSNR